MKSNDWSALSIRNELYGASASSTISGDLRVFLIDESLDLYCGVTSDSSLFLASRQNRKLPEFEFEVASLDNNKVLMMEDGKRIGPLAILKCNFQSEEELLSLTSLFSGLHNLRATSDNLDEFLDAITGLERYFSERQTSRDLNAIEVGLFGELVLIASAANSNTFIRGWHSTPFSTYDFGFENLQLEVKTSTIPDRVHSLRTSQTSNRFSHNVTYASIYAPLAENGLSIADVVELIESKLDRSAQELFRRKLSAYDLTKFSTRFDFGHSSESIRWIHGDQVPTPESNDARIRDLSWRVSFLEIDSSEAVSVWTTY